MILSDIAIKERLKSGEISISPFNPENLQPASYDLTLGSKIMIFDTSKNHIVDVKEPIENLMIKKELDDDGYLVHSRDFLLANIAEVTGVDSKHVGRLEGKSSLGRIGMIIHATAGFLDPGNKLRMTLEISNLGPLPIRIYPGMKIAQIAFETLDQESQKPYGSKELGSKYFQDMEVAPSKMNENFLT